MLTALKSFFISDSSKQAAHEAYLAIMAQSRNPVFYKDWQVEDTLDGRFDVIVLHMFLVLGAYEKDAAFCRALSELFFADMDRSLREMGVGDTGVGKRVKAMAQAFYGRLKAYGDAIEDQTALADVLRRNVWREKPVADDAVHALAEYMRRNKNPVARVSGSTGSYDICWDPAQPLRASQD